MNLVLQRFSDNGNSTLGLLFINGIFQAYTIEDEYRHNKVAGETRIPAGTYEVNYQELLTPLTVKYQERYGWFKKHIEIKDVPNFNNIYFHVGNSEDDTAGCIVMGDSANNNIAGRGFIGYSLNAFKRFYKKVSDVLEVNEKTKIIIRDEVAII